MKNKSIMDSKKLITISFTREELDYIQSAIFQYSDDKNYAIGNDIWIKIDNTFDDTF